MGIYLDPGNEQFAVSVNSELYVDKTDLNKYNVIFLDIQWMYGNALEEMRRNSARKVVSYIQEQVIGELRNEYSECVQEDDISLPNAGRSAV